MLPSNPPSVRPVIRIVNEREAAELRCQRRPWAELWQAVARDPDPPPNKEAAPVGEPGAERGGR